MTLTVGDILNKHGIVPENELMHYGVLGMRWGKHLPGKGDRSTSGKLTSTPRGAGKPGTHPDHRTAHTLEKKPVHQLSNNDVRTVNNRLQMERTLASLKSEKSTFNKGHNYVKTALGVAGTVGTAVAIGVKLAKTPAGQKLMKKGAIYLRALHVSLMHSDE